MSSHEERSLKFQQRAKAAREALTVPNVLVLPRDASVRKHIAHMPGNIKFPESGPAKWPFDTFTKRRIRDGDIALVDDGKSQVKS